MAKRIVKHTYADGRSEYVIQTNRIFGFIPIPWIAILDDPGAYSTFEKAHEALDGSKLVRTEVIETYKQNTRGW